MIEVQEVRQRSGQAREADHPMEWLPTPKRIRVMFNGKYIADSRSVKLLREAGHPPVYYFPADDVRTDLLHPTDHTTTCPYKGKARYWSIELDGREAENAVWSYPDPIPGAAPIEGYLAFYWNKVDAWFEEDQQAYVHPRDPYTRLDTLRSSVPVKVIVDERVLADSRRPTLLFETGLPIRYYLPPTDVNMDLLVPGDTVTRCPYKGEARYYSVRIDEQIYPDLVWYYPYPTTELASIQGLLCFYAEKVDTFLVDGTPLEQPQPPCFPRR